MTTDEILQLFSTHNYKATPQRIAIAHLLLDQHSHPSAEQIFSALKSQFPTMSLATIYKTLHVLKGIGVIHEMKLNDGKIQYDSNPNVHINLICNECGITEDFAPQEFQQIWHDLLKRNQIEASDQLINVYYQCAKCRAKT